MATINKHAPQKHILTQSLSAATSASDERESWDLKVAALWLILMYMQRVRKDEVRTCWPLPYCNSARNARPNFITSQSTLCRTIWWMERLSVFAICLLLFGMLSFSDSCKLYHSNAVFRGIFSIPILICMLFGRKKVKVDSSSNICKTSLDIIMQKKFLRGLFWNWITLWSELVSCACGRHDAWAACWRFDKSRQGSEFEKCSGRFERAAGFGAPASEMLLSSRMHKVAQFIWDAPFNSIDRHTRNRLHAPLSPRASAIHMGWGSLWLVRTPVPKICLRLVALPEKGKSIILWVMPSYMMRYSFNDHSNLPLDFWVRRGAPQLIGWGESSFDLKHPPPSFFATRPPSICFQLRGGLWIMRLLK